MPTERLSAEEREYLASLSRGKFGPMNLERLSEGVEAAEARITELEVLLHSIAHRLRRGACQGDVDHNTCLSMLEWIAERCPQESIPEGWERRTPDA